MASKYKKIWDDLLKVKKLPNRCSGVIEISYKKFKSLSDKFNDVLLNEFVSNFLDGKVILVRRLSCSGMKSIIYMKSDKFRLKCKTFHEMRDFGKLVKTLHLKKQKIMP